MTIVAKDNNIQIERLELGPFGTNAYCMFRSKSATIPEQIGHPCRVV